MPAHGTDRRWMGIYADFSGMSERDPEKHPGSGAPVSLERGSVLAREDDWREKREKGPTQEMPMRWRLVGSGA